MLSDKKAQSALEYMMTYGWAILIIVIVAVILYSMGIFNPSSSVTATSSGFSPFTPSSAICTAGPGGYTEISFVVGGLPNGASSVTIDKLYLTSPSGFSSSSSKQSTYISPTTVTPGQTFNVVIAGENCSSSGISFSSAASLQYSYSTPAGNVNANATGTIAGKSSSKSNVNEVAYFNNGGLLVLNSKTNTWTEGYTFSAWVDYTDTGSQCGYIIGMANATSVPRFGLVMQCSNTAEPYAETINSSGYGMNTAGDLASALSYNKWYFLVGVYNPLKQNISLYINGVLVASGVDTESPASITPIGNAYRFGMYVNANTPSITGEFSDLQAYNTALTASQIQALYNEGMGGGPIQTNNLIAWWPLDGNGNDYSGNGNNGVLYNVKWVSS